VDGYMGQGSMIITWVFTDVDRQVGGSCVYNPSCYFYSRSGKANAGQRLIGADITADNWYQVDGWACYDPPAQANGREKADLRIHP
jgi:hypothetical protein